MVEVKMLIKKVRLVRPVRFELTTFCSGGMNKRAFIDMPLLLNIPHNCAMSPDIKHLDPALLRFPGNTAQSF